jgi:hypothetical protein
MDFSPFRPSYPLRKETPGAEDMFTPSSWLYCNICPVWREEPPARRDEKIYAVVHFLLILDYPTMNTVKSRRVGRVNSPVKQPPPE